MIFWSLFVILWLVASVRGCMEAIDDKSDTVDKIGIGFLMFFIGWTLVVATWGLTIIAWFFDKLDKKR